MVQKNIGVCPRETPGHFLVLANMFSGRLANDAVRAQAVDGVFHFLGS
jgi:hypothetical protein